MFSFAYQVVLSTVRNYVINLFNLGKLKSCGKYFEISYHDGEETYIIRFKKRRGPSRLHGATSNGNDVFELVKQYAGPCHNFHGIETTPKDIGFTDKLELHYMDGEVKIFNLDDVIKI